MPANAKQPNALIAAFTRNLQPDTFQVRPYFPNLLNQPELLIVPEQGRLIAVYVYNINKLLTWHSALGSLEDLFELKTTVGPHCAAVAIILGMDETSGESADATALIQNTFDFAFVRDEVSSPALLRQVIGARPDQRLHNLWVQEIQYQQTQAYRGFRATDFAPLVHPEPTAGTGGLEDEKTRTRRSLQRRGRVENNHYVGNIKSEVARLPRPYSFRFDFKVNTIPPVLVDMFLGKRDGLRTRIRYLMAKARLMRYIIGSDGIQRQR